MTLQQNLAIEGLGDGPVQVDAGELPVTATVARVLPLSGRLWVFLEVKDGPLARHRPPPLRTSEDARPRGHEDPDEARGLGVSQWRCSLGAGLLAWLRVREALGSRPGAHHGRRSRRGSSEERSRLRDEFRDAPDRERRVLDFAKAPAGNVLVGVPTSFTKELVGQLVDRALLGGASCT